MTNQDIIKQADVAAIEQAMANINEALARVDAAADRVNAKLLQQ